jgi:hypothetical protein
VHVDRVGKLCDVGEDDRRNGLGVDPPPRPHEPADRHRRRRLQPHAYSLASLCIEWRDRPQRMRKIAAAVDVTAAVSAQVLSALSGVLDDVAQPPHADGPSAPWCV